MLRNLINGRLEFSEVIIYFISSIIVIFITMPIHEFAHAFAAHKLGDPTAKNSGRLTINPFAHINWMGALSILLFGFGWAEPVPVNSYYFKKPKRDLAITSAAGPLINLLLATVSLFIFNLLYCFELFGSEFVFAVSMIFYYIAYINIALAVFNLIPLPPLDGSKILAAILPNHLYYKFFRYERYANIILIVLIVSGVISGPLSILTQYVMYGIDWLVSLPFLNINI